MRSPSGLQACGHLALARGQGAPFCHRRCSMCSRAGTDAAVPTSSATSAPLAELAAPCSRPGHCQGVLAPRAAHARGRGGSTKRRRLLQACPTRYTGTRVNEGQMKVISTAHAACLGRSVASFLPRAS